MFFLGGLWLELFLLRLDLVRIEGLSPNPQLDLLFGALLGAPISTSTRPGPVPIKTGAPALIRAEIRPTGAPVHYPGDGNNRIGSQILLCI